MKLIIYHLFFRDWYFSSYSWLQSRTSNHCPRRHLELFGEDLAAMNHNLNTIPGSLICGNILLTTVGGHRVFTSILVEVKVLAANGQDTIGDWVPTHQGDDYSWVRKQIEVFGSNKYYAEPYSLQRRPSLIGNGNSYVGWYPQNSCC